MDPALWELINREGENRIDEVEAIIRLDRPRSVPPGVRIVSRFGRIATCRLPTEAILRVHEAEDVSSLKAARLLGPEPEPAAARGPRLPALLFDTDARRPPGARLTGAGVVVGVVDWGCDFAHPNLRQGDGSTRLLALWDQRGLPSPAAPKPYGYGTVHRRREIDAALRTGAPYEALAYQPADADPGATGAHGTHVMDIAAGSGHVGPAGVAPQADLVFVHLANRATGGLANLGDSVRILEAIDFVSRIAGSRPWVINLSVGRHGGPHDGCTLAEMAFDALLEAAPNRFMVQSAGNYHDKGVHASGRLRTGGSRTLHVEVDEADVTPNELEVWYSGGDRFAVRTESPTGARSPWVELGEQAEIVEGGGVVGRIYNRATDPNNADNHIDLFLYPGAPGGVWNITLHGDAVADGVYHAWLERDDGCRRCQARFLPSDADNRYSTGTLANGRLPLVVGAYDAHSPRRDVARFSSAGPTRDGRPKPDLVAPGKDVLAARSAPAGLPSGPGLLTRKSGTSMAAPHVTGTVALCLQAARRPLWSHEIRELVLGNVAPVAAHGRRASRFGRGYLNVARTVAAASAPVSRGTTQTERRLGQFASRRGEFEMNAKTNGRLDRLEQVIEESPAGPASEQDLLREALGWTGAGEGEFASFLPDGSAPDELFEMDGEGPAEEQTYTPYNVYIYVVGTDKSGRGDFNEMRKILQNETRYETPWLAVTYDYKRGEADASQGQRRRSWKQRPSDRVSSNSSLLGTDFRIIFRNIAAMGRRGYRFNHLYILSHFGN